MSLRDGASLIGAQRQADMIRGYWRDLGRAAEVLVEQVKGVAAHQGAMFTARLVNAPNGTPRQRK